MNNIKKKLVGFLSIVLAAALTPVSALAITHQEQLEYNRLAYSGQSTPEALEYFSTLYDWQTESNYYPKALALAQSITQGLTSDYDKALAIHDWVCGNISYDRDNAYNGIVHNWSEEEKRKMEAEDATLWNPAYITHRGVCANYANMTVDLLRMSGIPARKIGGLIGDEADFRAAYIGEADNWKTVQVKNTAGHGWTEAYVDGRWLIMDTAWDAAGVWENGMLVTPPSVKGYEWFDISLEDISRTRLMNMKGGDWYRGETVEFDGIIA